MKPVYCLTAFPFSLLTFRFSLILAALAASARADDDLYPASKIQGRIDFNIATGARTIDPLGGSARSQTIVWDCTANPPFYGVAQLYERLDWGDLNPTDAASVSGFEIAYCATSYTPDPEHGNVDFDFHFYIRENGSNSPAPPSAPSAALSFRDLPAVVDPNSDWRFGACWIIDVDLAQACAADPNVPCSLGLDAATDLDADGRLDFGYGFFVQAAGQDRGGNDASAGPLFAYAGPDPAGAPGATPDYNRYQAPGKWSVGNAGFIGVFNNGAQIYLRLFGCSGGCAACFDITGDHQVNLSDLAVLLSNFGRTPATYAQGDINHDNQVDLSDLAALLSAYGMSCP